MADTITEIHQRSRGTYGRRRIRAALLADYEIYVSRCFGGSPTARRGRRRGRRFSDRPLLRRQAVRVEAGDFLETFAP
ncbi:IS3 family transposase [Mycobacterium avium]|uniref:IS3 family transposase n=1 Tax=Mycobacterium avium TaxID=1764 RepID=UPI0014827067